MVKNYTEILVQEVLMAELDKHPEKYPRLCRCPFCVEMVKAGALNRLKPFYFTCVAGEVYGEFRSKELQNISDVLVAVVSAIEELCANPGYPNH